jgi:hypothetical protein
LPNRPELHERVKGTYWAALDEATDPEDADRRLRLVVTTLEDHPSAAACLAEDLPALCAHLKYFPRLRKRFRSSNLLERSLELTRLQNVSEALPLDKLVAPGVAATEWHESAVA